MAVRRQLDRSDAGTLAIPIIAVFRVNRYWTIDRGQSLLNNRVDPV